MTYGKAELLTSGEQRTITKGRLQLRGVGSCLCRCRGTEPMGSCLLGWVPLKAPWLLPSVLFFWFLGLWAVFSGETGSGIGIGSGGCPPGARVQHQHSLALRAQVSSMIPALIYNTSFSLVSLYFPHASHVSGCWAVILGFGL